MQRADPVYRRMVFSTTDGRSTTVHVLRLPRATHTARVVVHVVKN